MSLYHHSLLGYYFTPTNNSVSFSSTHEIKIYLDDMSIFLAGKNIIKAKLVCVFELLSTHPILSLTNTSGQVIDSIDTANNNESVTDVGNYTFVTFDITSIVSSLNSLTEIHLTSNSSSSIKFFGFNALNSINDQSSSPLKYIQFTHFENFGKKDESSFSSFDIGGAGMANISLVNGNLIFSSPTLVSNIAKTSYNISLCYNSMHSSNVSSGIGFKINTDWLFETISSNLISLTDQSGQKLLYELLDSNAKEFLSINTENDVYYCYENCTYIERTSNNSYKYFSLDKSVVELLITNNKIIFSSILLANDEEISFTYDQNAPTYLSSIETPDDIIQFEYTNGNISKIISTKKYLETFLTYSGNYLVQVDTYRKKYIPSQYPNMTSTLVRSVQFGYSNLVLTTVSNLLERRRLIFTYSNDKITNIKECHFDENNINSTPRDTYFSYGDSYAKITPPSEHDIYYYFNKYQRLLHIVDDKGNVVHYN